MGERRILEGSSTKGNDVGLLDNMGWNCLKGKEDSLNVTCSAM